ncbi:MAG: beta-galactosidase [Lachnospiraceae bacterium]|nr:beta-galactosidase [Lachnospiraceae bacterium]
MSVDFKHILYGGDYNPNQWPEEVWEEDMRYFDKARINSATINVFSWAKIQPEEDRYDFEELDKIVDLLSKNHKDIVMATSTGALPAWMVRKYPEVARTDYDGRHHKFGQRHNACPNSPVFQKYSARLAEKLAERYGHSDRVVCWHISNEYGGECYCENCEQAFRKWLKKKYETLENLNKAWNTEFWGHTIYDWDEIVLPNALGDGLWDGNTAFAGISIDYRRFNSDSMLANYVGERDAIRKFDAATPITTNLMGTYKGLDYFKWAKEMDIISWDNYPSYDTPWSQTAMCHDLMRGLKDAPFMLMEQTPSQQNWQPYNSLKKPGQMRAQSYQTMAHGADTIQFFQLRRSVGGCEKFHGAVIAHAGTDNTRVFKEVAQLGGELEKLGGQILGAGSAAQVGIVFDWDNYWALEYTSGPNKDLKYVDQIHQYYRYFYSRNIPVDMISREADFSKYKIVVAPVLYMIHKGVAEALETYVKNGGILVTGFMSGIVGESDNVYLGGYPGPLRKMAGIWVEELDALAPEQKNTIQFADGEESSCNLVCDIMHLEGAETIAEYSSNFYAGTPCVTKNCFGQGFVYYVGTQLEKAGLEKVLDTVTNQASVHSLVQETTALEVAVRRAENCDYYFLMNFSGEEVSAPKAFADKIDILTGETLTNQTVFRPYDVRIIKMQRQTDSRQ